MIARYEDLPLRHYSTIRVHKRKSRRTIPAVLSIILVILLGILIKQMQPQLQSSKIISPIASVKPKETSKGSIFAAFTQKTPEPQKTKQLTETLDEIKKFTETKTGLYSVYVYDFSTNERAGFNETSIFTAASVIKIPILTTLYDEAQNNRLDLDTQITLQRKDIQAFGTGTLQYAKVGTRYSLRTLANLLIQKSDNTAAYILGSQILGTQKVQKRMEDWGLEQTNIEMNKTSNRDMALLFEKLYKEELSDHAHTEEMLGFLKDTDFENRLPRLLPDSVIIHHKIGTEVHVIHDVGIVRTDTATYYIGVLSNDITDENEAETTIAEISKMVFDHFMNK